MTLYQHALVPLLGLAGLALNGVNARLPLRDLCPVTCLEAGANPSNWTVVANIVQLQACQRPMVLDLARSDIEPLSTDTEIETETKEVVPQLAWTPAASEDDIGGRLVVQSVGHLQSYLANGRATTD